MKSRFDFPELEGRMKWESEKYTRSHPNSQLAWTTVSTVENLRLLYRFVNATAGGDFDDERKFQHFLVQQGTNALESLYWLIKNHQYFAARGRARFLYEVYCALLGLNHNRSRAATKWDETRIAVKQAHREGSREPFEADADPLHWFRREGEDIVDGRTRTESPSLFYNLLSNRGSHPASLTGSSVDGSQSTASGKDIFRMGLVLSFGIVSQYLKAFTGTPTRLRLRRRADEMIVEIKLAIQPSGLPTFFREDLHLWSPMDAVWQ